MLLFFLIPFVLAKLRRHMLLPAFRAADLYPLFAVELFHLFFQICAYFGNYSFIGYARFIQYGFLLTLLLPILRRRLYLPAIGGALCTGAGTLLNKLVIAANGGKMPVAPSLSRLTGYYKEGLLASGMDALHVSMTSATRLPALADWIDLGFCIMSPGDVLIHLFVSIILYQTIAAISSAKKKPV